MPYVTAINIHLRHRMDDAIRELEMIKAEIVGSSVKDRIQKTIDAMIRAGLMIRLVEKLIEDDIGPETFLDEFGGISDAEKTLAKIPAEPDNESIAWIGEVFKNIP